MTLIRLFGLLFAVNLFTIGGGYVMLPLLQDFFVERYHLLTGREFLDAVALGQVTPGPLTVMNAFIGYKVASLPGAAVATIGTYMPSLIVVTIFSGYYSRLKGSKVLEAVLRGIKPAVVGMLAAVALRLGTETMAEPSTIMLGAAAFGLMALTKLDPTFVILGSGLLGVFLF